MRSNVYVDPSILDQVKELYRKTYNQEPTKERLSVYIATRLGEITAREL